MFFEAEISIALSRKSTLHTLCELSVTNQFPGIRSDYLRTQTASYFVELIEICTEAEHHEPALFDLLRRAFGFLNEHQPDQRAIAHFETELARIAGVHDANRSDSARALGALFGKLPAGRRSLLQVLSRR